MEDPHMLEKELNPNAANKYNEQQSGMKGNIPKLAVFYSHCFIPLFILVAVTFGIIMLITMNTCGPYKSSNAEFNSSLLPTYFVQISDLHFNHKKPKETEAKLQLFKNIKKNLDPNVLIFIGDIIDSSNSTSELSYHRNYKENWDVFQKAFKDSHLNESSDDNNIKILFVSGNHDEFAVPVDDVENHPFRRLFIQNDETPFILNSIQLNNTNGSLPFNFVLFNPIFPPAPTGPMNVSPFIRKEHIDELDNMILDDHINILVSHYPYISLWSNTDSSGKNIENVISKFDLMMSGHLHPKKPIIYKRGDLVNVVSCNAISNWENTTVYTIDNNMINVHNVDITRENSLLITYPISEESITSKTVFNKQSFDIRVLSISNDQKQNIMVNIDGKYYGSMNFVQQIRGNVQFYSFPIHNLQKGKHTITVISTNSTYTMTFYIGDEYESKRFSWYFDAWFYHPYLNIGLAVFTSIYAIIRIIPFWKISALKKILEDYESYFFNESDSAPLSHSKIFFYSLLDYLTRYRNITKMAYATLFIDTFMVLFVPLYITKLDTTNGLFFSWGTVINNQITYHSFNYTVWMLYNIIFLLPLGSFAVFMKYKVVFYCESFFYVLLMAVNLCSTIIIGSVLGEAIGVFGSPLLYIVIISYCLIIIDIFIENKNKENEANINSIQNQTSFYSDYKYTV